MTAFVGEAMMTDANMLLCIKCLCMYAYILYVCTCLGVK